MDTFVLVAKRHDGLHELDLQNIDLPRPWQAVPVDDVVKLLLDGPAEAGIIYPEEVPAVSEKFEVLGELSIEKQQKYTCIHTVKFLVCKKTSKDTAVLRQFVQDWSKGATETEQQQSGASHGCSKVLKVGVIIECRENMEVLLQEIPIEKTDLTGWSKSIVKIQGFEQPIELILVLDEVEMMKQINSGEIVVCIANRGRLYRSEDVTNRSRVMFLNNANLASPGSGDLFLVMGDSSHPSLKMFGLALMGSRQVRRGY